WPTGIRADRSKNQKFGVDKKRVAAALAKPLLHLLLSMIHGLDDASLPHDIFDFLHCVRHSPRKHVVPVISHQDNVLEENYEVLLCRIKDWLDCENHSGL